MEARFTIFLVTKSMLSLQTSLSKVAGPKVCVLQRPFEQHVAFGSPSNDNFERMRKVPLRFPTGGVQPDRGFPYLHEAP